MTVPFALPGDLVQFRIKRRGRKTKIETVKIERAESYPTDLGLAEPFCPHHGTCGGCRAQHLSYETQISLKTDPIVARMSERYAITPEILRAPAVSGHRNRMDFVVDGTTIGLRPAGDFSTYVDIAACGVQREPANRVLALVRELLAAHPETGFRRAADEDDAGDPCGPLKYATIRTGPSSGVLVLTIVPELAESGTGGDAYAKFIEDLRARLPEAISDASIVECHVDRKNEQSCVPGGRVLMGSAGYLESLGGVEFQVPYDSFFQPNPPAFDLLLGWCREALREPIGESESPGPLLDLYCGAGVLSAVFTSFFPDAFNGIRGYEFTESAVARAPENLGHFKGAMDFRAMDLNKPEEGILSEGESPRLVIMDPPRAGISPKLAAHITTARPSPWILYISCNPDSQLRDLKELEDAYRPVSACIADCYPQTPHLEQAVLLRRV